MHNKPKTSLKPKSNVSPSNILDHMTKQHKKSPRHAEKILWTFIIFKENMITQYNQRQEMLNIYGMLLENTTRKKRKGQILIN